MDLPVDTPFIQALPKAELHAHLSGSISPTTLHTLWLSKRSLNPHLDLADPAIALKPSGTFPTIASFFQIFNEYIYKLVDDATSVATATRAVVDEFERNGVAYLELRTTPRAMPKLGSSRAEYVRTVLSALRERQIGGGGAGIEVKLILSVDRGMSAEEAMEVVQLAVDCGARGAHRTQADDQDASAPYVVGVDLCGNPTRGDVAIFTPAFDHARECGLGITVHFAEVPASSSERELRTLLDWYPDRLGHAIHIPPALKEVIKERKLGLELCLSCNVLAKLTKGGFEEHHFGEWRSSGCPIALGTDDVGVFESALSAEYLIAATEFRLSRRDVAALSRSAVSTAFAGRERMMSLIEEFERRVAAAKLET